MKPPARRVTKLNENPYPGLRAYEAGEEHLFFGRERQVDVMVDVLGRERFLGVLGASGSGKSSLVSCGLVPGLHRGLLSSAAAGFRVVTLRPGRSPLRTLAQGLAAELWPAEPHGELAPQEIVYASLQLGSSGLSDVFQQARLQAGLSLLLIVDQFEELFRFRRVEADASARQKAADEATAFVNSLLAASAQRQHPIYVVVTMRSDYLGDCAVFSGLAEALSRGQYVVPRLSREERRLAIEGPARVAGVELEAPLVTRVLNDAGEEPDQLSLMQHALRRTYERYRRARRAGPITLDDYEAIGTLKFALEQHAEAALAQQTEPQRQLTERLFQSLTDGVSDPRGVRRPQSLKALSQIVGRDSAEVRAALKVFRETEQSFVTPALTGGAEEGLPEDAVVDISHESLMRGWQRLARWVKAEAESAQLYRRLASDAELHQQGKKSLWREPELSQAQTWQLRQRPTAPWALQYATITFPDVMAFLRRSSRRKRARQALSLALLSGAVLAALTSLGLDVWRQHERKAELEQRKTTELKRAAALRNELAAANARKASEQLREQHAAAERQRLEDERAANERQLQRLQQENPALERQLQKLLKHLRSLRISVIALYELNARSEFDAATALAGANHSSARAQLLGAAAAELERENQELGAQVAPLRAQRDQLVLSNQGASAKLAKISNDNQALRDRLETLGIKPFGSIHYGQGGEHGMGEKGTQHPVLVESGGVWAIERAHFLEDQNKMLRYLIEEYEQEQHGLEREKNQLGARSVELQSSLAAARRALEQASATEQAQLAAFFSRQREAASLRNQLGALQLELERERARAAELGRLLNAVQQENAKMSALEAKLRRDKP